MKMRKHGGHRSTEAEPRMLSILYIAMIPGGWDCAVIDFPREDPQRAPMTIRSRISPPRFLGMLAMIVALSPLGWAQDKPDSPATTVAVPFDGPANLALKAMKDRAEELHITGVAVVAFAEGDSVTSWSSKMLVVGNMIKPPAQNDKGSNLLAIAYAKASEMAATLKDSGKGVRPILTGELGWQGGVVSKGKAGIAIAAFSGGRSEDDVQVSRAGLGVLSNLL
jgi:hypothetical protein